MGFGSRVFRDIIRHPPRIYPGSSGNRSGSRRNQLFSISGDPGCLDAEKVKKLSGTTFFRSGSLFLSRSTFFCPGALFSDPEHFFSGIDQLPMVGPGNTGIPVFLRKRRKLGNFRKFLRFLGIPGHPEFFSPDHPRNPGSREKVQTVPELGPPCYIYRESALSIYIPGGFVDVLLRNRSTRSASRSR